MMTVSVRTMDPDDLPAVLGVMSRALGEPPGLGRTEELWKWKHADNPFGRSIVLVADVGGRVAGVRAFMRWQLVTPDGEMIRCVRAVDTATHPDFHRQGIFRTLTEAAVEEARNDGVHLIFNTPNPQSGAGYLKMGWSEVGGVRVMIAPSLRLAWRRNTQISGPLVDAPEGGPRTPIEDRPARGLRTPRTPEYLSWRFDSHPTARYRTVESGGAAAVLRENSRFGRPELVLSELFGSHPRRAAAAARRRSRAAYLIGSFASGSPERRAAMAAGLLPVPRLRAMLLVARPLADIGPVTDLAAWDLTLGDLELL